MGNFEENEELTDDCPDIKDIIDGLSAIHISKNNISKAEEPIRLDVEMKRLLNEMMSPPYDIINYESLARKDGVGDQPIEDVAARENDPVEQQDDDLLVDVEKTKVVEKKTRVTDLVMNSKQVLSEYLMSDESRKQQEEWEEKNETIIQVIELDYIKPEEAILLRKDEGASSDGYAIPEENEAMDNVELNMAKQDVDVNTDRKEAAGERFEVDKPAMAGASSSKSTSLDAAMAKQICKRKFENLKKKKWNINLKFWGFGKKKSRNKEEEDAEEPKYVPLDK